MRTILDLLARLARSVRRRDRERIDFQRERRIARALTLGFVPELLPELPGYETGLHLRAGANEATGGDVYGVWPVGCPPARSPCSWATWPGRASRRPR